MRLTQDTTFAKGTLVRVSREAAFFGSRDLIGQYAMVTRVDEPREGYENIFVSFNDPDTILVQAEGLAKDFDAVTLEPGDRVSIRPEGRRGRPVTVIVLDVHGCGAGHFVPVVNPSRGGVSVDLSRVVGSSTAAIEDLMQDVLHGTTAERESKEFFYLSDEEQQLIRDYRILRDVGHLA